MIGYVSNKIHLVDPPKDLRSWIISNLTLDNPEYFKRERMGKWTGNIPRQIALYEAIGKDLYLPFGFAKKLSQRLSEGDRLYSKIQPVPHINYHSQIKPYDYQERAIKAALQAKNGVLVMPCGAGKTQTALEIVSILGMPCLWLTHTQDLMRQSMNRAKAVLDVSVGTYGTITGGKVNIGTGITFATIQTMSKLDLERYHDMWGVIIVDECHHAVGSPTRVMQFYKVLSALSCRYKYGITATPSRVDGLERSMFALLGDIIYTVTKEDTAQNICPVQVEHIETGYSPDLDAVLAGDGTINYAQLIDHLIHDRDRFNVVMDTLVTYRNYGPMMVLASRVAYLKELSDAYNACYGEGTSICLSAVNNKAEREKRKHALSDLNDEKIECAFATYQLAKEGLDVPNLRVIVFATPEKDKTTVQQAAGRVERKAEGKGVGTVVDLVDDFGMFKGWARQRNNVYKKCNFLLTD